MSETLWDKFKKVVIGTIIDPITEIHILMPDSLLFGALLLYALTHNFSFGIFAVFIFEAVLSHKAIAWMFSQSVERTPRSNAGNDVKCRVGYKTPRFDAERMMAHDQYPSYGVFSITSIATYLAMATNEFSSTLDAMGTEWSSRSLVAHVFIALVVAIFIISRITKCDDSIGEVIISLVLAVITGVLFFIINKSIFGQESMNFLGLPYMVTKESQGAPIYVCSTDTSSPS